MTNTQFYRCNGCTTILLGMCGAAPQCCDKQLELLTVNTSDGATEKHIPIFNFEGGKLYVQVGSVAHPMIDVHYIMWIYVETKTGGMFKYLNPTDAPDAEFSVAQEDVVAIYEFCNIHGLWMTPVGE